MLVHRVPTAPPPPPPPTFDILALTEHDAKLLKKILGRQKYGADNGLAQLYDKLCEAGVGDAGCVVMAGQYSDRGSFRIMDVWEFDSGK